MAKKICGIYGIRNLINSKIYIGKSINIKERFTSHKCQLRAHTRTSDTNRHLFNSVKTHGFRNFEFIIIEELENNESLLKDRELFWMDHYKSCNRDFGYNLRRDSSTKTTVHPETIELLRIAHTGENNPNYGNYWTSDQKKYMSDLKKEGYRNGTLKVNPNNVKKAIEVRNKRWGENPTLKEAMRKKLSSLHNKYEYLKIDRETLDVLEVYQSRLDVLEKNPTYKTSPLLSVCNGWKSSYKGFLWRYRDRETEEIVEPKLKYRKP